jgi:hypothetical protein
MKKDPAKVTIINSDDYTLLKAYNSIRNKVD